MAAPFAAIRTVKISWLLAKDFADGSRLEILMECSDKSKTFR
jgi:hypothetical protein